MHTLLTLGTIIMAAGIGGATAEAAPTGPLTHGFVELPKTAEARFFARADGITGWFTGNQFRLQGRVPADVPLAGEPLGVNLFLSFEGSRDATEIVGERRRPGVVNFMRGADPAGWAVDLPTFDAVRYLGLYDGIDVVVDTDQGPFEYDLELAPGTDPSRVIMRAEGGTDMYIDTEGTLVIETAIGPFRQPAPTTWSVSATGEKTSVDCRYRMVGADRYGFEVEGWDGASKLVIDPTVTVRTFLGGNGSDVLNAVATGPTHDVYVVGQTLSTDYPTTAGAFDETFNGSGVGADDVIVARMKSNGQSLVYATYLGGTDGETFIGEFACGVVVNGDQEAVVVGTTSASDFPVSAGAFQATRSGTRDGFVTVLAADGATLEYSSYLGGSGGDNAVGVALDAAGDVYITGDTSSTDFPTTANALDAALDGPGLFDGFLVRLDLETSTLTYSTYFGGADEDFGLAIALTPDDRAVISGESESSDFPVSATAFNSTSNGGQDIVAMKIDTTAGTSDFATYLGSSGAESGNAVDVLDDGKIFLVGGVDDGTFPITPGAGDVLFAGDSEAYCTVFTPDGTGLFYSTFIGGSGTSAFFKEEALGVKVSEETGQALVVGRSNSSNFLTIGSDADGILDGNTDGFIVRVRPIGNGFTYSTLIGGASDDAARACTIDGTAREYIVGQTSSSDFATTSGSVQTSFGGGFSDAFLAKLDDGCDGGFFKYGDGCPGTGGLIPDLDGVGCPEPELPITLLISDGQPGASGLLLIGLGSGQANATASCIIDVVPLLTTIPIGLSPGGALTLPVVIPGGLPPIDVYLQTVLFDAGGTDGLLAVSNALVIGIDKAPSLGGGKE